MCKKLPQKGSFCFYYSLTLRTKNKIMSEHRLVSGFSKLDKEKRIEKVAEWVENKEHFIKTLHSTYNHDKETQDLFDDFSENTIANYTLPFGIAPNFVINGKYTSVPMVIEESSVVAAASSAAKFWAKNGGFHSEVISMIKTGQVHFMWYAGKDKLLELVESLKELVLARTATITANMEKRGGGVRSIDVYDKTDELSNYFQLNCSFDTRDAMGANFINTFLEEAASAMNELFAQQGFLAGKDFEIIMSILSNYTPECIVHTWVECNLDEARNFDDTYSDSEFVHRFVKAVEIATNDVFRATTHNKGIFNGIDSVVLATGNDFRAVEACGHAYAARDGKYRSLSYARLEGNIFTFGIKVPLALGTVGGITGLHPLAKYAVEIMGNPTSAELMQIASAVGLANNYSALKSLVTKGIQKGHMRMHLLNILNSLKATPKEKDAALIRFLEEGVSYSAVSEFINQLRKK